MSVATGAGPSNIIAGSATGSRDGATVWANVRPLDRTAAGAVGEWVDLLARISHDLRTPLNAVIGFSDVMQQELFGPLGNARYQEYVRHIRASGVELLQAAEDALAMTALLAEPKACVLDDVPLLAVVNDAMEDLSGRIGMLPGAIEIEIADDVEVRSDRLILTRAVRQLLMIGLAKAGDGARLRVLAEIQHGLVELRVEVSHSGGLGASSARPGFDRVFDKGLGRRDLGIWLATSMLDLIDCRLAIDGDGHRLGLRTTLEQSSQRNFFAGGEPALA